MHPNVHSSTFTIAKTWKQPKCPLIDEWINEMWYIYTMEYYSDIENATLSFVTTWMDLEDFTLSEIIKDKYRIITLSCGI